MIKGHEMWGYERVIAETRNKSLIKNRKLTAFQKYIVFNTHIETFAFKCVMKAECFDSLCFILPKRKIDLLK